MRKPLSSISGQHLNPVDRVLWNKPDPTCVLYLPGYPGYGSRIKDRARGNDGIITGATWARLPSGLWALSFATDDLINIDAAVNDIATSTAGTFELWTKMPDATPAAAMNFMVFGDTDADEYIQFNITPAGKLTATCKDGGTLQWVVIADAASLTDNVFAHVALVQDGTSPILCVNGVAIAQTFTTSTNKTRWFSVCAGIDNGRIGCINWNNAGNLGFLTGTIALTRIYTRALTVGELSNHRKQERHLFGV